jgi:hypothetical protein
MLLRKAMHVIMIGMLMSFTSHAADYNSISAMNAARQKEMMQAVAQREAVQQQNNQAQAQRIIRDDNVAREREYKAALAYRAQQEQQKPK